MTASVHLLFAPATAGNPFHVAKMRMIRALARLPVPQVDTVPTVQQIESIGEYVTAIARLGDQFMRAVGSELAANATVPIKQQNFQTPFVDAVTGFALWDVCVVAEELRCEAMFEDL